MDHRNLNHNKLTLAAIDNLLSRGTLPDWAPLVYAIEADPFGPVAESVLKVCRSHKIYGISVLFPSFIEAARSAAQTSPSQEPAQE